MQIQRLLNLTGQKVSNNSTTLLSGAAVIGVVATAILAVRATPNAYAKLAEARDDKAMQDPKYADPDNPPVFYEASLTPLETVKVAWKFYVPAGVAGCCTIACIIGSNQIGLRRNAAMLGAYTLVDRAFHEYKEEVVKQIGENKAAKVDEALVERKMKNMPVHDSQVFITGRGEQLFFETTSGRYFQTDTEEVRRLENDFNREIVTNIMYSSLNEWYAMLGLEPTDLGDRLGFNVDRPLSTIFVPKIASDGRPCIGIGYKFLPTADFGNL
jgi:Family of unknown function (DUF6353)